MTKGKSKRILFLVPYPVSVSPSQRFRFEQYFSLLEKNSYTFFVQSFLASANWKVFFEQERVAQMKALVKGFIERIRVLIAASQYDFIFIHREATPVGPPIFEWILAKILRKKIIFDFDDAIWLTDREAESWLLKTFKWRSKVGLICKWSYKVSCGNEYLCGYASRFNRNVVLNPTTIDTETRHNRNLYDNFSQKGQGRIRIGWTGTHSTLKYLREIDLVLKKILQDYPDVELVVIADKKPALHHSDAVKFVRWSAETEINDLLQFDIGIMPLPDDEWSKGKCGFKALQYMALALPAVASPVGVNVQIIDHGTNGFLCTTPDEWDYALRKLINDPDLRKRLGTSGRKTVVENYSVVSNETNFLSLFI